jgi:hypothetical protein
MINFLNHLLPLLFNIIVFSFVYIWAFIFSIIFVFLLLLIYPFAFILHIISLKW